MVTTVNERSADVEASLDIDPVDVGSNSTADGANATAVGVEAQAYGDRSVALGYQARADAADVATLGDRNIRLPNGRLLDFPLNQGNQTLANIPVDANANAGAAHNLGMQVGGQDVLVLQAEADGAGGVQNRTVYVPSNLAVAGNVTEVDNVVTGTVEVEDPNGNPVATLDGTTSPPTLDFHSNVLDNLDKVVTGDGNLQIDGDVTISGELTEGAAF